MGASATILNNEIYGGNHSVFIDFNSKGKIKNNRFLDIEGVGISLQKNSCAEVEGNELRSVYIGFYVNEECKISVRNNKIDGGKYKHACIGLSILSGTELIFEDNIINDTLIGLNLLSGATAKINNNIFKGNLKHITALPGVNISKGHNEFSSGEINDLSELTRKVYELSIKSVNTPFFDELINFLKRG